MDAAAQVAMYSVVTTAVHLSLLFSYFFLAAVAIPAEMTDMIVDVTETIAVV